MRNDGDDLRGDSDQDTEWTEDKERFGNEVLVLERQLHFECKGDAAIASASASAR